MYSIVAGSGEAVQVSDTDDATVDVVDSGIDVVKSVDRSIIRPNIWEAAFRFPPSRGQT